MSERSIVEQVRDIIPVADMESFEEVVGTMQKAVEIGMISIENARTKDHLLVGFPPYSIDFIQAFTDMTNNYRHILEKVYAGNCSMRVGFKVWANEDEKTEVKQSDFLRKQLKNLEEIKESEDE